MRAAWQALETYLRGFMGRLAKRPSAIVIVSAHWEATKPTVNAGARPALLFDYAGFPDYTYALSWAAAGEPRLAARLRRLLGEAGIDSAEDTQRGWDHGVFIPMKVALPEADIPVVQLSLQQGLDPARHLAIGRALTPLRRDGVLIIGSGQTYHTMRGFAAVGSQGDPMAYAFDTWLCLQMTNPVTRESALRQWEQAPGARYAQPHEDHLLPLMVVAGAASGEHGHVDFRGQALGKPLSGFRFGNF